MRIGSLVLALLALAGVVEAAPDDSLARARARLKSAVVAYDEGRYEEAARGMEEAYALRPAAELQYNLAQCYERLGRYDAAVASYRRYLDGKPNAEDRVSIEARIVNLEKRLGDAGAVASPNPAPATEKVVLKTVVVYREAPPPPGRGARVAAVSLVVLAAAALGAGVSLAVLAKLNADEVSRGGSSTMLRPFTGDVATAQQNARSEVVGAWIGFGVAAAAAAGAGGLYAYGHTLDREDRAARAVAVAPLLFADGGGLSAAGRF